MNRLVATPKEKVVAKTALRFRRFETIDWVSGGLHNVVAYPCTTVARKIPANALRQTQLLLSSRLVGSTHNMDLHSTFSTPRYWTHPFASYFPYLRSAAISSHHASLHRTMEASSRP